MLIETIRNDPDYNGGNYADAAGAFTNAVRQDPRDLRGRLREQHRELVATEASQRITFSHLLFQQCAHLA